MISELRSHGDQELATFIRESGVDISDILRNGKSWTALRRNAGLPTRDGAAASTTLLRRVRALAHVDDPDRMRTYNVLLDDAAPAYDQLTDAQRQHARMLFFSLWPDGGGFDSYDAGFGRPPLGTGRCATN